MFEKTKKILVLLPSCLLMTGCANKASAAVGRLTSFDIKKEITPEWAHSEDDKIIRYERWRPISEDSAAFIEYKDSLEDAGYSKDMVLCRHFDTGGVNRWKPESDMDYELGYVPVALIDEVNEKEKYIICTEVNLLPGADDKSEFIKEIIKNGEKVKLVYSDFGGVTVAK